MATQAKKTEIATLDHVKKLRVENPAEFDKIIKAYGSLKAAAEKASERLASSHKENGKYLFAARIDWIDGRESGAIARSKTFPEYHEDRFGFKPINKAESCANAVRGFVESGLITEKVYDLQTDDAIFTASRIFTKCKDDPKHPAMIEAAALLNQPGAVTKQLKELLERFVERSVGEGDDAKKETVFISPEDLEARRNTLSPTDAATQASNLAKNGGWAWMMAELLAIAQTTDDPNVAEGLFKEACKFGDAFRKNTDAEKKRRFDDGTLNRWRQDYINTLPGVATEAMHKAEYIAALEKLAEVEQKYGTERVAAWSEVGAPSPN